MQQLEKLKTGQLNLLLDFCNDLPSLARLPLPEIKEQLEQHLNEFYEEVTNTLSFLKGVDQRSYARSVLRSLKQVNCKEYVRSLVFLQDPQPFSKFLRTSPHNLSTYFRLPTAYLLDAEIESQEKAQRLQHLNEVLELLNLKLKEARKFVVANFHHSRRLHGLLLNPEENISVDLERDHQELFLDMIALLKSPEKLYETLEEYPDGYKEFRLHLKKAKNNLVKEIVHNYYLLGAEITSQYLNQMKKLLEETRKECRKLNSHEQLWLMPSVTKCLDHLLLVINNCQELQKRVPYLKNMKDLLTGSEEEQILRHIKKAFSYSFLEDAGWLDFDMIQESRNGKPFTEDVLRKTLETLKIPKKERPEAFLNMWKNLKEYKERKSRLSIYYPDLKEGSEMKF